MNWKEYWNNFFIIFGKCNAITAWVLVMSFLYTNYPILSYSMFVIAISAVIAYIKTKS